jgi:light-regulated signal transduction histidine kinase (bacteriophytochrome)
VGTKGKTPTVVDSAFAVEMALANLGTTIRECDATVTVGELPMVMADESQLMRVFQNLIGNALKFHRPDEPPRVEVSAEDIGEEWRFSVTDHGIGIPETGYEQVFEVFRRMVGRDEYPGTGIGLSICRRIIERLGGAIWVERSGEGGTTFCFTLPSAIPEGPFQTG